jgi:hypothetical protein
LNCIHNSRFDIDGRGQIDQKDLVKVIQDIGEGQSYDQIRSTIKAVDINATGKVEVDEFLEVKTTFSSFYTLTVFACEQVEARGQTTIDLAALAPPLFCVVTVCIG